MCFLSHNTTEAVPLNTCRATTMCECITCDPLCASAHNNADRLHSVLYCTWSLKLGYEVCTCSTCVYVNVWTPAILTCLQLGYAHVRISTQTG